MKKRPKISEAEWKVMKVLWAKRTATANEVVDALSRKRRWKPKTIRTLINRLVSKGALGFEKDGRRYIYCARLSEAQCIQAEAKSFLGRAGRSALKPMLAAFIEEQKLSNEEIAELKTILERKGKE